MVELVESEFFKSVGEIRPGVATGDYMANTKQIPRNRFVTQIKQNVTEFCLSKILGQKGMKDQES